MRNYWKALREVISPITLVILVVSILVMVVMLGCTTTTEADRLSVARPSATPSIAPTPTNTPIGIYVPAASSEPMYSAGSLYATLGKVLAIDSSSDVITIVDSRGFTWEFYGVEDWQEGDLLCAIFFDAGTLEPYDDMVISATYVTLDY